MYQVTVDYAKTNLEEICDRADQEPEGVAIVRDNRSYVLVAKEKWDLMIAVSMAAYEAGDYMTLEQYEANQA